MVRITGRITSCATLALLLVANAIPAQGTKMSDVADQLRTALAGESVTVPDRWDRPQPRLAAGFKGLDDDHTPPTC
jgi:hypothetical protein